MGLNSPAMIGAGAQEFLDGHPPAYLDLFPTWSWLEGMNGVRLPARLFQTSTPYTVTGAKAMRMHVLATCFPAGVAGHLMLLGRPFSFRCRPPAPQG
jgi:hypothetical protein